MSILCFIQTNRAYVDPRKVRRLDNQLTVQTLLFGQGNRLQKETLKHINQGDTILQVS